MESGRRSISPGSLKRKRDSLDFSHSRASPHEPLKTARLTNGATSLADTSANHNIPAANRQFTKAYTSPDSDEMHQSDPGDLLRGVGSASSLNSAASSVFSHNSQAFAHNRNTSIVNGLTPLTNHTESSPPKGNSPQHMKSTMDTSNSNGAVATSRTPASDTAPSHPTHPRKERRQMLPPPGKAKGYRVVWDPELDVKLSKEERKRATPRKKEFGTEVRNTFRNLLSLRHIIHIT